MSEMELTADHLVVIARGRLVADMPLPELIERHSMPGDGASLEDVYVRMVEPFADHRSATVAADAGDLRLAGRCSARWTPCRPGHGLALRRRRRGDQAAQHPLDPLDPRGPGRPWPSLAAFTAATLAALVVAVRVVEHRDA